MRDKVELVPTDWDAYYQKPFFASAYTRKITQRKISSFLSEHCKIVNPKILELGGANSCFVDALCEVLSPSSYNIIDSNEFGIELTKVKYASSELIHVRNEDIFSLCEDVNQYDIVFSVGLIEHFDQLRTAKSIDIHFNNCSPGGIVLITFPTPTYLYRSIRKLAESLNLWDFPDERPLKFEEVRHTGDKRGQLTHHSINWKIGLTQGYVVYRKGD